MSAPAQSRNAPVKTMPVRSMTGFARISGEVTVLANGDATEPAPASWTLSIKSVNHRFLDLHLRLPANSDSLEMHLRRILKQNVMRGHLELTLSYEPPLESFAESSGYDQELIARYLAAFRDAQQQFALKQEPDLNVILRLPGVFFPANSRRPEVTEARHGAMEALETAVLARLGEALAALAVMRETEGAALVAVLIDSVARLERDVHAAAELRSRIQSTHYARLQKKMTELIGVAVDRDRLLQEAALLADRSDIEEELARLRMHVEHFRTLLREGGEVGKKLDFLLQEMNREANTLLSKSAGMGNEGSKLTVLGLQMKSEIEKAREQVQNLE